VLQGRLAGALEGSKATPVSQGIEVVPEFGRAIEALLGSAAEAIQVSDLSTARRIFAQLEQEQIGSVVLRIAELGEGAGRPRATCRPASARGIRARPYRGLIPPARSSPHATSPTTSGPSWTIGAPTQVSPSSRSPRARARSWTAAGIVSGGHANPKKQANSIVQREIDLRETAKALADDQRRHEELRVQGEALNARIAAAEQSLEERRAAVMASTQA
jgi:chromosome segregation protein